MKTYFNYALLSAIAFVGATGFTACSSEDEIVNNPNYDPVDNTVKAQLAISLASNTGTTTRQADNIVQGQETLCISRVAVLLFLGSGACSRSGDKACCQCIGSHRSGQDTSNNSLALLQKHCNFPSRLINFLTGFCPCLTFPGKSLCPFTLI